MKILVLDDDSFMLKVLGRMLQGLGVPEVTVSDCAEEALKLLRTEDFGLVLCDLNMPQIDGVEFIRRLAGLNYAGGVVVISGEAERVRETAAQLVRAHGLDFRGHLQKPVTRDQMQALLAGGGSKRPRGTGARSAYQPEDLRAAIEGGQLVNYYQPKVTLATGALVGVETLVRWRHPQNGLVPPDQFIPLAEESGLINQLTRYVISEAVGQARRWREEGLALKVAVNVSMDDLSDLAFPDFMMAQVAAAGLSAGDLMLEVTESRLMKDPRLPLDTLARLQLKRFDLSIDDFGTGNSSLVQLRDLPFSELKIDRSFVHGACRNERLKAMCEAGCGLAQKLGIASVGEGVEDADDWYCLLRVGCQYAQGYFIGRPMPASELDAWHVDWRGRQAEWDPAKEPGSKA